MAANTTNIKDKFKTILEEAEEKLLKALLEHYQQLESNKKDTTNSILKSMNTLELNSPPGSLVQHDGIMQGTIKNIQKVALNKQTSTNNKLAALHLDKTGKRKIFKPRSSPRTRTGNKQANRSQMTTNNNPDRSSKSRNNKATPPTQSHDTQEQLKILLNDARQQATLHESQITSIPETPEGTYHHSTTQILAFSTPDSRLGPIATPTQETPEYKQVQQDFQL